MSSKNKENLSEADVAYKEELDSLVSDLLNTDLCNQDSEDILLKLVDHATNDYGNISTIPKALQFLISHKSALDEYYKRYTLKNGEDTYSLVLLLELVSFLDAINLKESPKKNAKEDTKKEEPEEVEAPSFKLLLYKLEANLVAARLLSTTPEHSTSPHKNGVLLNGVNKDSVEFNNQPVKYKLSEKSRQLLAKRKVSDWGNEYLISLFSQIVSYYSLPSTRQHYANFLSNEDNQDLKEKYLNKPTVVSENNVNIVISENLKLIEDMTTYWLPNGFEFNAIDLLLEVDRIESITDKCPDDYDLVSRVSSYLASISSYGATSNETSRILQVTYNLLMKNNRYVEAARVALKLNDHPKLLVVLNACKDLDVLKQISLMLGSNHTFLSTLTSVNPDSSRMNVDVPQFDDTVVFLNSGENRSNLFLGLCKELDVLDPKHPNEVFKGYPSKSNISLPQSLSGVSIDSARDNLSYTYVNGFINCATSNETLINPPIPGTPTSDSDKNSTTSGTSPTNRDTWLFKHQGYGLLCASASLGLIHLWNLDQGLSEIDKYQYSTDQYIRSGSYLAFGLVSCGIVSELDPIQGLLIDKLDSSNFLDRLGSILGLGFAYSGTNRQDMLELLIPQVIDLTSMECSLFSSLALSVIFVGTGNQESSEAVLQVLMEYLGSLEGGENTSLNVKYLRLYLCSLGLLNLCRGELCEPLLDALKVLGKYEKVAVTVVESFAYATSGDVLKVQTLLKNLISSETKPDNLSKEEGDNLMDLDPVNSNEGAKNSNNGGTSNNGTNSNSNKTEKASEKTENVEVDKKESELFGLSILCISLMSLGENIGSSMLVRLLEHPLQCGSIYERRAVPLAIALVNVSNPSPQIVSALSKLSHDPDKEVSLHAIFGLGLVGAGTNNSRISQLLQNVAKHSYRDSTLMYVLRLSVGLLFMGKGTLTLSPLHSEGFLLNKVALAGLLVAVFSALDLRSLVCDEFPFIPLFLALAIRPKWLITLNQDLEVVNIPVRVGTAVDTIGTAGKQRRISGFQTHKSPVLIGVGERAELATEEYESYTPFLEDVILVKQTPNTDAK